MYKVQKFIQPKRIKMPKSNLIKNAFSKAVHVCVDEDRISV